MSQTFYDWLENGISGKPTRKSGAIIALNMANKPAGRLEFKNALVKSVVLPKLDAKSSDNAVMTVTMSPEIARSTDASTSPKLGIYASSHPKPWRSSGFKLSISGLEKDCAHVLEVDSIAINEKIKPNPTGAEKYSQLVPVNTDYSNIIVTLRDTDADGFTLWADDFMIKGNSSSQYNKSGTLDFFAPSSNKAYFELGFDGLGIYSFSRGQGEIAGETVRSVKAGLYCSGMKFSATAAAIT
jgi:hypothetical protein